MYELDAAQLAPCESTSAATLSLRVTATCFPLPHTVYVRRYYVLLFLSPAAPGSLPAQFPEVLLAIVKFSLEGADHTTWNGDASVCTPTPLGGFTNVQSTSIGADEETAVRLIASHRVLASCLGPSHQAEP